MAEELKKSTEIAPGNGNLKEPWKPGQSGNPSGYPKGVPHFKTLLDKIAKLKAPKEKLNEIRIQFPDIPEDAAVELVEAATVHKAALAGESWAYDRLHGKAQASVDLTSDGEKLSHDVIVVNSEATKKALETMDEKLGKV
jgi:hypothetical protein